MEAAEHPDTFGELKAEFAELRGRVDMLLWAVGAAIAVMGLGFSAVIGILAATS